MKVFQQPDICFHNGLKVGFCIEYGNNTDIAPWRSLVYKVTPFFGEGFNQNPKGKKMVLQVFIIIDEFISII